MAVWSGDLARRDADGFLWFVGRGDDQIKISGVRVSPTEIEQVAAEVPGVDLCVAVGVADELLGQRIVLYVTAAASRPRISPTAFANIAAANSLTTRRSQPWYSSLICR